MSEDLDKLSKLALGELLFTETLKALTKRIRGGEATAADMAVALATAKHMGISALPTTPESPAGRLAAALTDKLPFAGTEDVQH